MKFGSSSLLGLAIGDREIACVQIAGAARRAGAQAARFDVPQGLSLDAPEALGEALCSFLREHRMNARRAVLGVPARWLIAEPRQLPPTTREQALASLRLQAERIALGDDAQLVFDIAGTFGTQQAQQVLLVGLSQDLLQRLKRVCAAAQLEPLAVTATGLVVAESLKQTVEQAVILFSGEGAELVWRTGSGPRAFRHLSGVRSGAVVAAPASAASAASTADAGTHTPHAGIHPLATELWRTLAMSASQAQSLVTTGTMAGGAGGSGSARSASEPGFGVPGGVALGATRGAQDAANAPASRGIQRIILLGEAGVSEAQCSELAGRLGRDVDCMPGLAALRHLPAAESLNGQSDRVAAQRIWPALALAGAAARGVEALPVNFLRPKLAAPKPARVNRTWALGIATALLVVLGIGVLWWQASAAEAELALAQAKLDEYQPQINRARAYVASVSYARGFFETRPPVLDLLRDLSESFERDERIWTTGFSLRDNGRGQLQGRAEDQQTVLALADRLKAHPNFAEVRLIDMREAAGAAASGRSRSPSEIGFTLSFMYVPRQPQGAQP